MKPEDKSAIRRDVRVILRGVGYDDDNLGPDGDAVGLLELAVQVSEFCIQRDRQRQGSKRSAKAKGKAAK